MVRYLFVLILLLIFKGGYAQYNISTSSDKARKHYYKALKYYRLNDAEKAIKEIEKARMKDSLFVELWILRGDILHLKNDTLGEIFSYNKAIQIFPDFFPNIHFILAELYFARDQYREALDSYRNYIKYSNDGSKNRNNAIAGIKNCQYLIENKTDSVRMKFFTLNCINSDSDEYWPFVSASGKQFFFTRKIGKGKYENEDVFVAQSNAFKQDSGSVLNKRPLWIKILPLFFNTYGNEGNYTMTADCKYVYFSASDRNDGYGRFDIYVTQKKKEGWSEPVNIGSPINTGAWESQPSISPDGQTLYFASNRKGGVGGSDIWKSELIKVLKDGKQIWSEPVSLSINTPEDEMAPFVYFDNSTLFFSSKGYPGRGGYDIYKVENIAGIWGNPVNMSVNDKFDNMGFALSPDGITAYFSSVTKGGNRDIFYYKLPNKNLSSAINYLYGGIYDSFTGKKVFAKIKVSKYSSLENSGDTYIKSFGEDYAICLPCKDMYSLNVIAKGYDFYSEKIDLLDSLRFCNIKKNIFLKPISLNSKINLSNIYFNFDSYRLDSKSFFELSRLVEYLELNNNLVVEIGGHTDDVGDKYYNIDLSLKRAKEVYLFLIEKGISKSRLQFKGYGSSVPLDYNNTKDARKRNRRTEVRIIKID